MADETGKEALFEIFQVGNSVKITAIDPETGIEVSTLGPPDIGLEALKRTAASKLFYVLGKDRGKP